MPTIYKTLYNYNRSFGALVLAGNWEFSILWWLSAQISPGGVEMGVGPSRRSEWNSLWLQGLLQIFRSERCHCCWTPRDDQLPIGGTDGGPQQLEELGIKRRRLRESLLRVIQSESQEDSNHSAQARQAQYLDTVDEVFGRILLRATFAGRCCCWWSNYLFRWLKLKDSECQLSMSWSSERQLQKQRKGQICYAQTFRNKCTDSNVL